MEDRVAIIEWCNAHHYLWVEDDDHIYWQTNYQTVRDDGKCYHKHYLDFILQYKSEFQKMNK